MSARDGARFHLNGVILVAVVWAGLATFATADDVPERKSRDTTAAIRLPPRSAGSESSSSRSHGSTSGGIWTTVLSLGAIVGCLGFAAFWLKPYLGVPGGLPLEAMELLGRRPIEHKVAIHLVRCGSRVLVVSVSPEGARTLSEITDPAEVQRLVAACHAPRQPRSIASLIPGANSLSRKATGSSYPDEDPRRV
jgi:flagellar biogenesis protein FliO